MYLICTFGLGIKNTAGIADSKKRKHENNRGGKSFQPNFITTKLQPQMIATGIASNVCTGFIS